MKKFRVFLKDLQTGQVTIEYVEADGYLTALAEAQKLASDKYRVERVV